MVTKAQAKATAKYEKNNYDKILLRLPKGTKDRIKEHSESINGFITLAILEKLNGTDPEKLPEDFPPLE